MSELVDEYAIVFSCQSYEIGVNAPYENTDLLVNKGTRKPIKTHKDTEL